MSVIKIKLNQIVKMGYKSTYKSEMIQTRLEQGYYDDIVEAGIQGGYSMLIHSQLKKN